MRSDNIQVLCLQRHPELFNQTIDLLNNQWPRSDTARRRILEQGSVDGLPTSLVLVEKENGEGMKVIAHSKISAVPYKPELCFVESVVVDAARRGKGFGRIIMEKTEEYVKSLGVTTVYLTTFDQQEFYRRLGYDFAEPIVVFGGSLKLSGISQTVIPNVTTESVNKSTVTDRMVESYLEDPKSQPPPPPPPPPPLNIGHSNSESVKVTMRKILM